MALLGSTINDKNGEQKVMIRSCLPKIVSTFAAALLASGIATSALAQEPVVLKFASFTAPTGLLNAEGIPEFIREVEAASEGTLKIEFYPGGSLGGSPAIQLKLVEDGVADMAQVVASYTPGRFPELGLFELPFLAANNVEGSLAAWRMFEAGHLSGFENVHMLGFLESGPYGLHGTFPITDLDSVKGKKIRAAGPVQGAIVEALGAVPVGNIAAPSIAEGISRRLLDGSLMSVASLYGFRIVDAATEHLNQIPMGSVSVIFPMNKAKYESLPPKAKAALDKFSGDWFTRMAARTQEQSEAQYMADLKSKAGHTIHTLSDAEIEKWRAALEPVKDEWNKPNAKGVNLYEEVTKILEDIRAEN